VLFLLEKIADKICYKMGNKELIKYLTQTKALGRLKNTDVYKEPERCFALHDLGHTTYHWQTVYYCCCRNTSDEIKILTISKNGVFIKPTPVGIYGGR